MSEPSPNPAPAPAATRRESVRGARPARPALAPRPTRRAAPAVVAALVLGWLAPVGSPATAAAAPRPADAADLTGDWVLNAAASQTLGLPGAGGRPGPLRTAATASGGPVSADDSVLPDPPARQLEDGGRPRPARSPSWRIRPERVEATRVLLGETRSLSILQTPTYVDLRTELGSRSLEIGAESQVSLPTGELADQRVRWRGRRLVIERRVPGGVKVVETYQHLPATDQLEVTVRRRGGPDDGLGKVDLRRIFDRDRGPGPSLPTSMPGP